MIALLRGLRAARRGGPAGLALVYHRVAERAGDRERELLPALDVASFRGQLDWLSRRFELVRASDLFQATAGRSAGDPLPLALSFDDDLASHAELVTPELEARGVPGSFFLGGTGLDDADSRPWWELLEAATARAPDEALGGMSLRESAAALEALPPEQRAREAERLRELAGPRAGGPPLDADGVRRIAAAGMEIGFHTLAHDRLTDLRGEALEAALDDGRERLAELAGAPLRAIAYPHGAASPAVIDAARRAGYQFGFTTDGSALGPETDPLAIGRLYPPRSPLRLRVAAWRALGSGLSDQRR